MAPKLYKADPSPAARAAMMACEIFNAPVEMMDVDLFNKNPLHTVPVYEDGDFVIHDSHAILIYLAEIYGKTGDWYPKDIKKRALINQMLFFEIGMCFPRLSDVSVAVFTRGEKKVTKAQLDRIEEAYGFVEQFLNRTKYIATNHLTIADISVVSTLSTMAQILPWNPEKFPKTDAWVKVMEKHDFYQKHNVKGINIYGTMLRKMTES